MSILKGAFNTVYVFVEQEDVNDDVETSEHSVEEGIPITDTVKRTPIEISISGSIVDYPTKHKVRNSVRDKLSNTMKASTVLSMIKSMKNCGELITYSGRNYCKNMQITSFSTSHPNTITGGANFSMTLKECRIVSNAYVAPTVQDSSVKDGGNQQVDKGENEEVWYTTKGGDCVAALVAEPYAPYKNLKREGAKSGYWGACDWVMEKNPSAFSRYGDFKTLQIDKTILLGTR